MSHAVWCLLACLCPLWAPTGHKSHLTAVSTQVWTQSLLVCPVTLYEWPYLHEDGTSSHLSCKHNPLTSSPPAPPLLPHRSSLWPSSGAGIATVPTLPPSSAFGMLWMEHCAARSQRLRGHLATVRSTRRLCKVSSAHPWDCGTGLGPESS